MCLIVVKPKGIDLPKSTYLKHAAKRNADGQGMAYLKKGENIVKLKKDFKEVDDLIKFMDENITKEDDLIIHFRFATHGLKDEGNRHPFPLTKNKSLLRKTELTCKSAVAHNGVLTQYSKSDDSQLSDSQHFVLEILSDSMIKENFERDSIQILINDFLNGDRLAILNNKGKIWLFGDFSEEDGISYSNSGYKPYEYTTHVNNKGFHANINGFSHWGNFENDLLEDQSKNKQKKIPNDDGLNMSCNCEGCGKWKKVKFCDYKSQQYILCKRCRKRARKNKLVLRIKEEVNCCEKEETIKNKSQLNVSEFLQGGQTPEHTETLMNDKNSLYYCASCRELFIYKELNIVLGGSCVICTKCKEKMKEDPDQALLFSTE